MKKLTFALLFLIPFTFTACSGTANETNSGNENIGAKEITDGQVNKLTADAFQKLVWDYKSNPKEWVFSGDQPVIIDFYADWCKPCRLVAPIMDELSKEYNGKVRIYKVNTDEQKELAGLFNINSIPAVLFIPKNGKPQMSVGAMQKEAYVEMIRNVLVVN
ncbi:MAG: thioredoxin [Bacteroidales bacterium]|nr:thioredoxin [Bacteroidales bacterium]